MKNKKKKLTYKQMLGIIAGMDKQIQQTNLLILNLDKVVQEYIDYKEETESFKKFLEKKYKVNDTDNQKTEEE
jgi:hypothetical protein